MFRLNHETELP